MSAQGGGGRVTSTPEETAGVEEFDRGFVWAPQGRPCHPLAYLIEALPYAVYSVFLVLVIVAGIWGASMFAGPTVELASGAVDDVDLNPFGGSDDSEAEADPVTPTSTETVTETELPTETAGENPGTSTPAATATPSPSPSPSPTATIDPTPTLMPSPTPTNGGGVDGAPTDTITATTTITSTATPTATASPTPIPSPTATPAPSPANFGVTIDSTNSPVTEGETLDVTATVHNSGDKEDTQTVVLTIGGTQRDSTEVNLAGGQSETVTLSWPTTDNDADSYTAIIDSEDDSASTSVVIEHPQPNIKSFNVNDNSDCGFLSDSPEFEVTWDTEYTEDEDVTVTLPDGTTESGTTGSITYSENSGCGDDYTFKISADNEGGSDTDSTTVTAGG